VGGLPVDAARIGAAVQQQGDQPGLVVVDRREERRAAFGVARVRQRGVGVEHAGHLRLVAALDRGEELVRPRGPRGEPAAVEMRAQGPPARKAVLARDRQLSVGKAGARLRQTQLAQTVLGELLQVLEVGAIGKRHDPPSFHVPVSAVSGGRWWCRLPDSRWVRPFTRTVSRLDG